MNDLKDEKGNIIAKESERTKLIKFTRVVGFIRPVNSFNNGKQEEFKQRSNYVINEYRD
jgi:anaerobic ribonucleoside-triphosphate reductase